MWLTFETLLKLLRDIRFLQAVGQIVFLIGMVLLFAWLIGNGREGLRRAGLLPGFSFLSQPSSFQIDEGLTAQPHTRSDSFAHAFALGLLNTLRVVSVGLILASLLGLAVGVGRLSSNWLIRQITRIYIEIFQNTPLLVQLIFLYSGVFLTLPSVREAVVLPGPIYLSVRGVALPALVSSESTPFWWGLMFTALVAGLVLWRARRRQQLDNGKPTYGAELGVLLVIGAGLIGVLVLHPYTVSLPATVGPRYVSDVGAVVSPEYVALVIGLVLYTSAFIGEIVRSGIQSVPPGQWEAARAQGFSGGQTLRLIILPQALRVMFPPLTNQYLNLLKNSSLGAAIGYADVFGIGRTIQLQSGESIPVTLIIMLLYLSLSLLTSFVMNTLNARFQLKTR